MDQSRYEPPKYKGMESYGRYPEMNGQVVRMAQEADLVETGELVLMGGMDEMLGADLICADCASTTLLRVAAVVAEKPPSTGW